MRMDSKCTLRSPHPGKVAYEKLKGDRFKEDSDLVRAPFQVPCLFSGALCLRGALHFGYLQNLKFRALQDATDSPPDASRTTYRVAAAKKMA